MLTVEDGHSLADSFEAKRAGEIISRVLDAGSRNDKKLFFMRYWMGMSIEQIREQTGFGESRIKMSLLRTRKKIAEALGKEGITV